MSHITIIISRKAHEPAITDVESVSAEVSYTPSDDASEQDIAHAVKRIYRQVKNLGSDHTE